jgi:hypothetical protein
MLAGGDQRQNNAAQASGGAVMTKALEYAKRCVVKVGNGGRGFVVNAGDDRYIITAAHCVPPEGIPTPHLSNSVPDLTFPNIIGALGGRQTIWGELCVYSLADDIAAFRAPDGQALYDECGRYEKFTDTATLIGRAPKARTPQDIGTPAYMLSLNGRWQRCAVHNSGRFLFLPERDSARVKGGMSGSPILDENGAAIGLFSTSDGGPGLSACLPPWLLRKLQKAPRR